MSRYKGAIGQNKELFREFLGDKRNADLLLECADQFLGSGKRYLALLCVAEAARIEPTDARVLTIYQDLWRETHLPLIRPLESETCLVSVITRAFKRHESLREALSSIVCQDFSDLEVVVVNDAGDPALEQVIAEFSGRLNIKYVRLEENLGQGGALDAGVRRASGRYIAYLDDDDVYYERHLSTAVAALEENQESDFYYSNVWWVYGDEKNGQFVERERRDSKKRPSNFSQARLLRSNFIPPVSVVHRRTLFSSAGSFRVDLRHNEDWEFFLRASAVTNFIQGEEYTAEYRWRTDNVSWDQVSMHFFSWLIGQYYRHRYVDVIELRRLLVNAGQQELREQLMVMEENADLFLGTGSALDVICSAFMAVWKDGDQGWSVPRLRKACVRHDPLRCLYAGLKCRLPDVCVKSIMNLPAILGRALRRRSLVRSGSVR